MQMQSYRTRNLHRMSEIADAQRDMDQLEANVRRALTEVLKQHGVKLGDMTITLNLGTMPSLMGQSPPAGYLSASLDVE